MGVQEPVTVSADSDVYSPIDHNFHQEPGPRPLRWESSLPPAYWEYRKKWHDNPTNQIVGSFPIHLDIEATSSCNLRCVMCPRTEHLQNGTFWKVEHFDLDLYKRLIDEGVQNGLCSVKYNYLGEPTLNKNLIEMIEYAKAAGVVDVMFNTNATMLTEDLCRRLVSSGLDKLFFSFDSPYREQFNEIRVDGDYDTILGNIKRFARIRDEMGSASPFTRVSMVIMEDNQTGWQDFKALFEPIVDAVASVDYLDHSSQEPRPDRTVVEAGSEQRPFCCPQLWQRMFVHPDGVVTPCCLDSARVLRVGNVQEQTAAEIWTGAPYQRLRDLHAAGRYDEIPTCAGCALAKY